MTKPSLFQRVTWDQLFCLMGIHRHQYDTLLPSLDGGKTIVRTKCPHCGDLDYGSELVDLRIERKGKR